MKKQEIIWLLSAVLSLSAAVFLGMEWEKKLIINPQGQRDIGYSQSSGEYYAQANKPQLKLTFQKLSTPGGMAQQQMQPRANLGSEQSAAQKIYSDEDNFYAYYKFTNFKRDSLSINYSMSKSQYKSLVATYGYKASEMQNMSNSHKQERSQIWNDNLPKGEAAAKRALKISDDEYETKLRAYLYSRGLALRGSQKTIEPDVPNIVRKNKDLMKKVAVDINSVATENGYTSEDIVGTVLSFVQTALVYRQPPMIEKNGVHTVGIFPPFRAILTGWGDCDTKSALAASILGNWKNIKLVGISVPNHYLMAIRRMPVQGDMYITYKDSSYVLVEPAGPAWLPPGSVAEKTKTLLAGREHYIIEPILQ